MDKQKISVMVLSALLLISAAALGGLMINWHSEITDVTATSLINVTSTSQANVLLIPGSYLNSTMTINNTGDSIVSMLSLIHI